MSRDSPPEQPALVSFRDIDKSYGDAAKAVSGLNLDVRKGEFLTLLGPSGSGKTSTLMMLAGFEAPSAGDILLNGRSLAGKPPHQRNMGVVFQNYALFPHMSVAENLAFPLRIRNVGRAETAAKVSEMLSLVYLEGLGSRRPDQLSGGQRQRVALARALIFDPDIVLMDEPLGALDRQLRERLQVEIKRMQRRLGVTVVYVTHDQGEALTLSDRIAVFASGTVQQVGTPRDIYERPANAFVAGFVGENNGLPGVVTALNGSTCDVRITGDLIIQATAVGEMTPGDAVLTTVRPEHVRPSEQLPQLCNSFEARVEDAVYNGDHSRIFATLPGGAAITMRVDSRVAAASAEPLTIGWCADRCFAYPATPDALVVETE